MPPRIHPSTFLSMFHDAYTMTDGLEIPDKLSEWTKGGIVEHIGSDEEHTDTFYRHGNLGAEQDKDGTWEAYTIVDGHPIKVKGDMMSFEEVVEFFKGSFCSKRLADGKEGEDDVPDAEDEPEHPQGDDEVGVTLILKSITEMMSADYDGCAVRKARSKGDGNKWVKDADKKAKDTSAGQTALGNKAQITSPVSKTRTMSGLTNLKNTHELNPRYIGGDLGASFKNDSNRKDPKTGKGIDNSIFAGTGKDHYSNFIKHLFGADNPGYYKRTAENPRGGVLRAILHARHDPKDLQAPIKPQAYTRADKDARTRPDMPLLTDNYSINQMNDLIERSYRNGMGQHTWDLDMPVIGGIDSLMLDAPYMRYQDEDEFIDPDTGTKTSLSGKPISVYHGDDSDLKGEFNLLNPHLFAYGTKRSLHPKTLARGQRRLKEELRKRQNSLRNMPISKIEYETAEKLAKYLEENSVGKDGLPLSQAKYDKMYHDSLKDTPVREVLKFLKNKEYAHLRGRDLDMYRGPLDKFEGGDDAVLNAIKNTDDPAFKNMLQYIADNPPGFVDSEGIEVTDVPPKILYPYQRALSQILDHATPSQLKFFLNEFSKESNPMDQRLLPTNMSRRGYGRDLDSFNLNTNAESTLPTEEARLDLVRFDPFDPRDPDEKYDEYVEKYGKGNLPKDYLRAQVEAFDKFHEDYLSEHGKEFDPSVLTGLFYNRYLDTKDAVDNYKAIHKDAMTSEDMDDYNMYLRSLYGNGMAELEMTPLNGAGISVQTMPSGENETASPYPLYTKPAGKDLRDQATLGGAKLNNPIPIWWPRKEDGSINYTEEELKKKPHAMLRRALATLKNRAVVSGVAIPEKIYKWARSLAAQTDDMWDAEFEKNPDFFKNQHGVLGEFYGSEEGMPWNSVYSLFSRDMSSVDEIDDAEARIDKFYSKKKPRNKEEAQKFKSEQEMLKEHLKNQRSKFNAPSEPAEEAPETINKVPEPVNDAPAKPPSAEPAQTGSLTDLGTEILSKGPFDADSENPLKKSISVMIMEKMSCGLTEPEDQEPNLMPLNEYPRSIIMGAGKVAIPDPQHIKSHDVYKTYPVKGFPDNFPGKGE